MSYREVSVIEVREVLRAWLAGAGLRTVAAQAGVDRKTARRYVAAAEAAGVVRDGDVGQLSDEVIAAVVTAVRPVRPEGHGTAWQLLQGQREQITAWVEQGLTVVKIGDLLARRGVVVPYRTLHRFCVECCGFGRTAATVRVADGEPGVECQIDFARMGLVHDSASRAAAGHPRADLHRGVLAAHVRVADVLADAGGGDRRVRGGVGVLRRLLQGPGPGQHVSDRGRRRRGQPAASRPAGWTTPSTAGSPPTRRGCEARRTSHASSGPSSMYGRTSSPARSSSTWPTRRPGPVRWCTERGRAAGARHDPGPPGAGVRRAGGGRAAGACRRAYDVPIVRRARCTATTTSRSARRCTRSRRSTSDSRWTCGPTRRWSRCSGAASWSRFIRGSDPVGGGPTRTTCPSTPPRTRCATWTASSPPPVVTAPTWASTPSGCWTTSCRGPGCARSTGCSAWPAATATNRSTPPAAGRSRSTWSR